MGELSIHRWKGFELYPVINKKTVLHHHFSPSKPSNTKFLAEPDFVGKIYCSDYFSIVSPMPHNPNRPIPKLTKLLDQVRQVIRLKHTAISTEQSYTYYIKNFILFHNKRHPREMGVEEIRTYLTYLAVEKHVAPSTQNIALNALLFLYRQVLHLEIPDIDHIERAKRHKRIPIVFSKSMGWPVVRPG
jgi:hypothetical protein